MSLATRPKRTTYHKKLSGKHHRHSKPYLKAYWPYLPMLLIVGVGIVVNSVWSSRSVLGVSSDLSSLALVHETNTERIQDHETALTIDQRLSAAAQAKANDMAQRNYWSHNTPDGKSPWAFITATGYHYQAAGENLAYGFSNAADTVAGWMNSPEHRANILNPAYQHVGFGIASSPNYQGQGPETIVVAEYAKPAVAVASAGAAAPAGTAGAQNQPSGNIGLSTQSVSRIQLLTGGQATWSALAVSALAGAALALFVVRYGLGLRRLVLEGESFVAHHPLLDIAIVFVVTAGFILTRAGGITH